MKIKINQDNIKNGVRNKPESCAIACALNDAEFRSVKVFRTWFVYEKMNNKYLLELPENATKFIQEFDDGYIVLPTEFEINEDAAKQIKDWYVKPHELV